MLFPKSNVRSLSKMIRDSQEGRSQHSTIEFVVQVETFAFQHLSRSSQPVTLFFIVIEALIFEAGERRYD